MKPAECIRMALFIIICIVQVAKRTKVADDIKEEETVISDEAPATGSEHVQQSNTEVSRSSKV